MSKLQRALGGWITLGVVSLTVASCVSPKFDTSLGKRDGSNGGAATGGSQGGSAASLAGAAGVPHQPGGSVGDAGQSAGSAGASRGDTGGSGGHVGGAGGARLPTGGSDVVGNGGEHTAGTAGVPVGSGGAAGGDGTSGSGTGGDGTAGSGTGGYSTGGQSTGGQGTAGGGAAGAGGGGDPTDVTVQLTDARQPIQGFGINTALAGGSSPISTMFSTTGADGIGLSILRVGMNTDGSLTGQGISEAREAGAKIIGTTWSAPASCKSNGKTTDGGFLLESCYDSWSQTIADFAQQQDLYAMSIANESDFASCPGNPVCTDSYNTMTYTARQMVAFVKVAGPKLRAQGIKVIAPEAAEWIHTWSNLSSTGSLVGGHPDSSDPHGCGCFSNTITVEAEQACAQKCKDGDGYDYGHWLAADAEAWGALDIIGVHQYDSHLAYAWPGGVNDGDRDKEVWQTEVAGTMHWPEQGPSTDINNGVAVAEWIHSALTIGEASAWLYWWYEAYYQNDNEGLALTQESGTIAKRYYTLGNYSKFVRPGYTAVGITGEIPADVLLSAYSGDGDAVVVVAINKNSAPVDVPITIAGGTAPSSMAPWVTSASENLTSHSAVSVTGSTFTASLPAQSVTTFVGD